MLSSQVNLSLVCDMTMRLLCVQHWFSSLDGAHCEILVAASAHAFILSFGVKWIGSNGECIFTSGFWPFFFLFCSLSNLYSEDSERGIAISQCAMQMLDWGGSFGASSRAKTFIINIQLALTIVQKWCTNWQLTHSPVEQSNSIQFRKLLPQYSHTITTKRQLTQAHSTIYHQYTFRPTVHSELPHKTS